MDRHGLSILAMKRVVFYHKGSEVVKFSYCHCEEDRMDDAAIHRVSGDVDGFVSSGCESQWIATGLQPSR